VDDLKFSRSLWVASAYTLLVTSLYLFGYWGRFGLNVLEFIGIGDIVSHALMPFLASMAFAVLGFVISTVDPRRDLFPPGGGAYSPIGRFGRAHWKVLLTLDLWALALVAILGPEPLRWFLVIILIMPVATALTHIDFLIAAMPNPSVRAFVLDFSLMIAAAAFAVGRQQADSLLKGAGPLLVDVVGSGLQLKSDASHPVSYVGHVTDFFVLYDSAQSQVVILNTQKVTSLVLTKNPQATAF
jgi:hypothetical protein